MALFMLKPLYWNTRNYQGPSGVKAAPQSYPGMYGYGHEEWNNSPRMKFRENGQGWHVFHTESIKDAPVNKNKGQIFVFMTAAHDGVEQLVGVAGNAAYLGDNDDKAERNRMVKLLDLADLWHEAWELPRVRKCYDDDKAALGRQYRRELHWLPNWICPDDFFWWPEQPITLDPKKITGKQSLPKMFSAYMPINLGMAEKIMSMVPAAQRRAQWSRLVDAMQVAPSGPVDVSVTGSAADKVTSFLATVHARNGQGKFRTDLLQAWEHRCAVTGIDRHEVLRASHIKPWGAIPDKKPDNLQRLDVHNGLLLSANLDCLFEHGLISFADNGEMLVSTTLTSDQKATFGVPQRLRKVPSQEQKKYLAYHRENKFKK